jgi:hypothetical protein
MIARRLLIVLLVISSSCSLATAATHSPCDHLVIPPSCLSGEFSLEVVVNEQGDAVTANVVAVSTAPQSPGSILPFALCVAAHMPATHVIDDAGLGKTEIRRHVPPKAPGC